MGRAKACMASQRRRCHSPMRVTRRARCPRPCRSLTPPPSFSRPLPGAAGPGLALLPGTAGGHGERPDCEGGVHAAGAGGAVGACAGAAGARLPAGGAPPAGAGHVHQHRWVGRAAQRAGRALCAAAVWWAARAGLLNTSRPTATDRRAFQPSRLDTGGRPAMALASPLRPWCPNLVFSPR